MPHRLPLLLLLAAALGATETENLDFTVLPAPAQVVIDGGESEWDLTQGVFACGDVENARDKYGVWLHAMWDERNLYVLARWQDLTPLSNPGSIKGDYGFNGDCLQVRVLTSPRIEQDANPSAQDARDRDDPEGSRVTHLTCWRDRDGLDTVNVAWGRRFSEGGCEGKDRGAQQAFRPWPDGRGYTQELAVPWALLSRDGWKPAAGARIALTFEPNFTVAGGARLTIKDVFKAGIGIDRVFTFQGPTCWGFATLAAARGGEPRAVRLADRREFPVRLVAGVPTVDWTGLVRSRMPEGFKPIRFALERDGYVSLNVFRADGSVARQLLTCEFLPKGEHEIRWDGLGTMSVRVPGQPQPPGEYRWDGIVHDPITLRLRGWAGNSGERPWGDVWGADHGDPICCAADSEQVYVGWNGGEGAKPLLACDPDGHIRWKNIRGGLADAALVASDGETVFALNDMVGYATRAIYRVAARTGAYTEWSGTGGTDLTMAQLFAGEQEPPGRPDAMAAGAGTLWLTFGGRDLVLAVDATTGAAGKRVTVTNPGDCELGPDGRLYVIANGGDVVAVGTDGQVARIGAVQHDDKSWVSAIAVGHDGEVFCALRGARHDVVVLGPDGAQRRVIGKPEGRPLTGPWKPDGMLNPNGLAIDARGKLWVAEQDGAPRRVSVWDAATGAFEREFFGASTYGAIGGAIDPSDPQRMVGAGCEWRIDEKTGRARVLGVVTREGMGAARYGFGPDGKRLYLAVTPGFLADGAPVRIFERLGDGDFKLRAELWRDGAKAEERTVSIWSDENDDGARQEGEVRTWKKDLGGWFQGWYMAMTPDLAFCGSAYRVAPVGWTACGAPRYDLDQAQRLPAPENWGLRGGMGAQHNHASVDGRFVLWNAGYGEDHGTVDCFDIASGKALWSYPSNFTGVHGSHRACAGEPGMIRGAYDIVGAAKLPAPIGNVWVIPTNKGEWHALTERGFYLTRFFEGDPMKVDWPAQAVPGADVTRCPPGAGEEAFGGSMCQASDGSISLQGGHVSFWNVAVDGLESVKALPGGALTLTSEDARIAAAYRERALAVQAGGRRLTAARGTPSLTGDLAADFGADRAVAFERAEGAGVRVALAWDDAYLYAGWEVHDATPWINGADAPEFMYARGDTVDLQLGTDPAAPADRDEEGKGDLRLSIGAFHGEPTAVLYRRVADEKHAMSFHSGVVHDYPVDSVTRPALKLVAKPDADGKRYVVEAAIPWATLGAQPKAGLTLRGDLGATHGNAAGDDTVLRSYWCNLNTGLVSDEVYELRCSPREWGEIRLGE